MQIRLKYKTKQEFSFGPLYDMITERMKGMVI